MTTVRIGIEGMHCEGCVASVRDSLMAIEGVHSVEVSLEGHFADIAFDEERTPLAAIVSGVEAAGFAAVVGDAAPRGEHSVSSDQPDPSPAMVAASLEDGGGVAVEDGWSLRLDVEGMHCAACVHSVESALLGVAGVSSAHVNLPLRQAVVRADSRQAAPAVESLLAAVAGAGYEATPQTDSAARAQAFEERDAKERTGWGRRTLASVLALSVLLACGPLHWIPDPWGMLSLLVATFVQAYAGAPFYRGAAKRLRSGSANMDTLVVLGVTAAYGAALAGRLGWSSPMPFLESAMILAFISFGRWLESGARGRATQAIFSLMRMAPERTRVLREGRIAWVDSHDVAVGETILVEPGETTPLDGRVVGGASEMNESWLTGEAIPVRKAEGDPVYAGAINGYGGIQVQVSKRLDDTALAQVVQLVRDTQQTKTEMQRLADIVVAWFTPAVLLVALGALATWWLLGYAATGVQCGIAVLIVACPCAMGLATPMAILVGSSRGASRGVLVKTSQALETGGLVDTVVIDKTGTITSGRPEVDVVLAAQGVEESRLLRLAASAESLSRHPLAEAIVAEAEARGIEIAAADGLSLEAGEGVRAIVGGQVVRLGKRSFLESEGVLIDETLVVQATQDTEQGRTVVWVSAEQDCLGALLISDGVPAQSREAILALQRRGMQTLMFTGDGPAAAKWVADQVGLEAWRAEMRPDEKLQAIEQLSDDGRVVAMVGDGINDGPALVAADLGIAIGAGADIAIDSADVVLVRGGLWGVVETLDLAASTRRIIRENLAWAFGYNIVLIPVAAGALAGLGLRMHPAMAAAAMALSSLSVVLNALRVGRSSARDGGRGAVHR